MSIDKNCLNCDAKLHKDDIFCLECESPVLTEDDITLMPNAATTRVLNELDYNESSLDGSAPVVDDAIISAAPTGDTMSYSEDALQVSSVANTKKERKRSQNRLPRQKSGAPPKREVTHAQEATPNQDTTKKHDIRQARKAQPANKSSRNTLVAIALIILVAVLAVSIFVFMRPTPSLQDETGLSTPVSDIGEDAIQSDFAQDGAEPAPPVSQETLEDTYVTSIILFRDGRAQTEFHTKLDEVVTLHAQLLPEGSTAAITWTSSDPDVLEIISFGPNGSEASVVGKVPGVVDITVSAGNFEMSYIVFVDDYPMHIQLQNAINNKDEPLWLILTWTSGQHNGDETVFEWDDDIGEWIMEGAYSMSQPEPIFGETNNALTIGFEDTQRVYYFFADGTGHYRNPDGTNDEDFVWIFKRALIEPEG